MDNGQPVSRVTGGGSPAVPRALPVTAECQSPSGTPVTLDGSSSSDPDGDTLFFSWVSPDISLSNPDTALATGSFPLGTSLVELAVEDGTHAGGSAAASRVVAACLRSHAHRLRGGVRSPSPSASLPGRSS